MVFGLQQIGILRIGFLLATKQVSLRHADDIRETDFGSRKAGVCA